MMKNYITELIGTFFLVFVVGLTVAQGTPFAPIAIGVTLMVMVYMGGHISGAHYNPAVTLAVLMRGSIGIKEAMLYMISQIIGGLLAGLATFYLLGGAINIAPNARFTSYQVLFVEVIFTFALALTVLNVATSKDHPNNSFYGLAIGSAVIIAAFAGGAISGGAFNPAVALGQNIISSNFDNLWLYTVGPFTGAALAALVFKLTNPKEFNQ